MSTLKVEVVAIDAINPHPNADRLELATVFGWQVVVGKGNFKAGDKAIYLPVDAVLPADLEAKLFPPDAKIKLSKSRIRSIRIRGAISQGMLVRPVELDYAPDDFILGEDIAEEFGITKYEPPEPAYQVHGTGSKKTGGTAQVNPNFGKYSDIQNVKWYPNLFADGEMVYISEKLHGTSARYGYVPRHYTGFWGALKQLLHAPLIKFGWMNPHEFVYGSRNVQLQTGKNKSWYKENVYAKIAKKHEFNLKLKPGECVYGEIVGDQIQKNYTYGCSVGEHKFYAYDVKVNGRWLDYAEFVEFCVARDIPRVPMLYVGPYSKEVELAHRDGDSTIGGQKIREGVVIKPLIEEVTYAGRKVLKSISDAYYLEDNSDFH